jgi:hypothetical protein
MQTLYVSTEAGHRIERRSPREATKPRVSDPRSEGRSHA